VSRKRHMPIKRRKNEESTIETTHQNTDGKSARSDRRTSMAPDWCDLSAPDGDPTSGAEWMLDAGRAR